MPAAGGFISQRWKTERPGERSGWMLRLESVCMSRSKAAIENIRANHECSSHEMRVTFMIFGIN